MLATAPHAKALLPLGGITVIEICHSMAGPYAGSILAELGAEVIKVEHPTKGDDARAWGPPNLYGTSTVFHAVNRGKKGVTVDLKNEDAVQALRVLIMEEADVVIQNLRPGVFESHSLSAKSLTAQKPALIYCNIGSYGAAGPLKEKPGYDPLMQARSGLMSVTGHEGQGPVRIGTSLVDMGSGMWAAIGILAALNRRNQTGVGGIVDTSLFEASIAWMSIHLAGYLASGTLRRPMGSAIAEIVPHQAFRTRDGYLMVAAGNDLLFSKLATALGQPQWSSDPRFSTNNARVENRHDLIPLIEEILQSEAASVWALRLDGVGVPNAKLQNVADLATDPQLNALDMIQKVPGLDMSLVGLPLLFDGKRPPCSTAAPRLGEHNTEIFDTAPLKARPRR